MKMKSILSLLLCCLLLFSPALAQSESQSMQTALTNAKTVLHIPEEYTEFSYYSETDKDGTVYWFFNWSGEKKGSVEATVSEDGFLANYYAWVYTESYNDSLANYTHDEAREIAKEFIQKVNPEIYPALREVTPDGENRDSRTAYFVFREFYGDIPSFSNTISVTVDKYHGIVRNYQGAKKTEDFKKSELQITEDEAKLIYIKEIGIGMEYHLYYDYQKKEYTVFPVYHLKDTSGKAIDAITGQMVEPCFSESYLFGTYNGAMSDMVMKEEAAAGVPFTPEELEAISNLEAVYSKEEILQIAEEKIPALKAFSLYTSSLQRDYRDETKLLWYLRLKHETDGYANVTLDAKTAQLVSFSVPAVPFENKNFTLENAKKVAEEFLRKEASDVFGKTQFTEDNGNVVPLKNGEKLPDSYWLTFERTENGIGVSQNTLSVRVDAKTGQVGSFQRSWTEGLEFPDISTCMSEEEIMEKMDEEMEFTLVFLPTKEGQQTAYTFLNPSSQIFDPCTGVKLNYDGTPVTKTFVPEYTDIKGHWAEEMILALLDNGYYFSDNEFCPDDAVTKKEFLAFFKMIGNDSDEKINEVIAQIEEIKASEADCNAPLTKEVAAAYLMYRMGYQKAAKLDHIFVYPFQDGQNLNPKWKGDIALGAGFGVFRGDETGNFYPEKQLSRAEAASILYHFLKMEP